MNIITKVSLFSIAITYSLSMSVFNTLQAEEVCSVETCIQFNNIQLNLPPEYVLDGNFKEYAKYIKSVDNIPTSSLHVKNRNLCLNFCDESYKGEIFAGGDGSKKLRAFHEDDYSTSLWDIQFTREKETTNTTLGIIYNEKTMLQITDDKDLWLALIDQMKNKSLKNEELKKELETEVLEKKRIKKSTRK
ncbi:hypothetical protein ACPUVO_17530 [Pseudocolwellia sp. HL-MZ19]|uniref:hypothetical protein n=1 Tax=Pseudocolwellia sp. HL-MZ19 TaxID=3400846 RepID=UPI003CFB8B02